MSNEELAGPAASGVFVLLFGAVWWLLTYMSGGDVFLSFGGALLLLFGICLVFYALVSLVCLVVLVFRCIRGSRNG